MSTYRIHDMADRVVLVHEMADQTIFSELDVDQADVLLQQLNAAVQRSLETLRNRVRQQDGPDFPFPPRPATAVDKPSTGSSWGTA